MSPVLEIMAARFRVSSAGRTNTGKRDLIFPLNGLLKTAGCLHGPGRHEAVEVLQSLEALGLIILERHSRDRSAVLKVRLPIQNAPAFFAHLGLPAPEAERVSLAEIFRRARSSIVPERFRKGWEAFSEGMAEAALAGASIQPFDRSNPRQATQIMEALPAILAWEGESMLRFASTVLFKDSKTLEALRPRLEACLARISGGTANALADFGMIENEGSFLIHGPLDLRFGSETLPLQALQSPARIGARDIRRAQIETTAARCLTVENAAMLHELAKLRSDTVLASSGSEGGFANSAVIAFLKSLPANVELWHFGDSDPKGFDILRDMRERSSRTIRSLHMFFRPSERPRSPLEAEDQKTLSRLMASTYLACEEKLELEKMLGSGDKGRFEQESLGRPSQIWPFYATPSTHTETAHRSDRDCPTAQEKGDGAENSNAQARRRVT
jgi:hypothetical protein